MKINEIISEELNLPLSKINAAVELLDQDNTIAFVARYRKEVTGNLDDENLRNLDKKLKYYRNLEEKMNTVLISLEKQGVLTDELKNQIDCCRKLSELEDIYRPYKPKKKTRASIAIAAGLKDLAETIIKQINKENFEEYVLSFVNEEKNIKTKEDAIQGAKDIIAEQISDEARNRKYVKSCYIHQGLITSIEDKKDEKDTFKMYADYKEKVSTIPNYRVLAINRGEQLKCLKVKFECDKAAIAEHLEQKYIKNELYVNEIKDAIADSLKRLIYPSIENEIRNDLFLKAEDASIIVFENNLRQLLMYPPLKNKTVLGFDPGFRTGCKIAVVDKNGNLLAVDVAHVTDNSQARIQEDKIKISKLIEKFDCDYIALGNGTASRESEVILRQLIKEKGYRTKITIVNESGASVYSASELGNEEFPDLTVEKRSAISLARRLQDPLSELVKIDPKAIGVGQYQHDMNQGKLDYALTGIVEECVNKVGINLNTASVSLLKYISGISPVLAKNIYNYRLENGEFKSRNALLKVSKMGPKAYQQCAGFLRIKNGKNPLDNTGVHPESYDIAEKLLASAGFSLKDVNNSDTQRKIEQLNETGFFKKNFIDYNETMKDIIDELIKPGHDARDDAEIVELNEEVKDIKDLKIGMVLTGIVHNICDFGAFVDINVHQDGLVHISEISNKFIKHPLEVLSVNQVVKVKVITLDVDRKKIGLSIKQA